MPDCLDLANFNLPVQFCKFLTPHTYRHFTEPNEISAGRANQDNHRLQSLLIC